MDTRFKDILLVTTATGTHQADVADLNNILMVMADCKATMIANMTAMVLRGNGVSRNGMSVRLDSIDTWGDL